MQKVLHDQFLMKMLFIDVVLIKNSEAHPGLFFNSSHFVLLIICKYSTSSPDEIITQSSFTISLISLLVWVLLCLKG